MWLVVTNLQLVNRMVKNKDFSSCQRVLSVDNLSHWLNLLGNWQRLFCIAGGI